MQFVWRGRLYLVRGVLAHWVELGTWWSARGGGAGTARGAGTPMADGPDGSDGPGALDRAGLSARPRSVAADVGAVEREVWRVEAAPGRSAGIGVYDLVRDVPAGDPAAAGCGPPGGDRAAGGGAGSAAGSARPVRWRLARALD
ncbi:MAG: hypothetical protein GC157_08790 [Frankiales bacterium]|nr:hypothetical protein [Frankiales bacterium]